MTRFLSACAAALLSLSLCLARAQAQNVVYRPQYPYVRTYPVYQNTFIPYSQTYYISAKNRTGTRKDTEPTFTDAQGGELVNTTSWITRRPPFSLAKGSSGSFYGGSSYYGSSGGSYYSSNSSFYGDSSSSDNSGSFFSRFDEDGYGNLYNGDDSRGVAVFGPLPRMDQMFGGEDDLFGPLPTYHQLYGN